MNWKLFAAVALGFVFLAVFHPIGKDLPQLDLKPARRGWCPGSAGCA